MRQRLQAAMYVLAVLLLLAVLAWLRGQPEEDLPPGSSYSSAASGTRALYLWLEAVGARPERLEDPQSVLRGRPDVLLVIQPQFPVLPTTRPLFDAVPERRGTLLLAGDSPALENYASQLGVRFASFDGGRTDMLASPPPSRPGAGTGGPPAAQGLLLQVEARRHILPGDGLQPELLAPGGEWLAASKPYQQGRLVVFTPARLFTNEGLRDPDTARFLHGLLTDRLGAAPRGPVAPQDRPVVLFDEVHRTLPGAAGESDGEASMEQRIYRWVLGTSIGSAAVYGTALIFLYLLLSGRRLGPPLRAVSPGRTARPGSTASATPTAGSPHARGAPASSAALEDAAAGGGAMSRTMYEHVQALAGLYRRSRQLGYVRAHYARHYRRRVARIVGTDAPVTQAGPLDPDALARYGIPLHAATRFAAAIADIEAARSERQLTEAVRHAEALLAEGACTRPAPQIAS